MQYISIAIDGPAGAGKSTVAKQVAECLHLMYIDTGAMYRAVTWKLLQAGVSLEDNSTIGEIVQDLDIRLSDENGRLRVLVDGQDVTQDIRSPEVTRLVSHVSRFRQVRDRLVALQRQYAKQQAVVMDGRDIGSNVLPDAKVKIFLTASIEERAERRVAELQNKGYAITIDEVRQELVKRDQMDMEREIAPLRQASDAQVVDTTNKTIEEVVKQILTIYYDATATVSKGGQA
ncbi:(d)CMP kinase [Fodinisporobacter ferrooxydans]|uniref:Cytidylate kinase n=1 Tax=Fodinisporobacter ferrooxydans TaxID=2901836 RepID=A0ABY4CGV9_9BACL|nr:(d)CMP kinase [Alicyclobacillaceae bacterium MYW30-H2]